MASNSTPMCFSPDVNARIYFVCYVVVTPIILVLGILAYIPALIVFYRRLEMHYRYQVCFLINRLLEMIANGLFVLCNEYLSGQTAPSVGVVWFRQSYTLMWMTAHLTAAASGILANISLLLCISMAGDRIFAFVKPFTYRNINHKRHEITAILSCYVCGYLMGGETPFRYTMVNDLALGMYKIVRNSEVLDGPIGAFFTYFRLVTRLMCVVALFICNSIMIKYFLNRIKKTAAKQAMINAMEFKEQVKMRNNDATLVAIIVCQAVSTAIPGLLLSALTTAPYFLSSAITIACLQICTRYYFTFMLGNGVFDLYLLLALSKKFRRLAFSGFSRKNDQGGSSVALQTPCGLNRDQTSKF